MRSWLIEDTDECFQDRQQNLVLQNCTVNWNARVSNRFSSIRLAFYLGTNDQL